MGDPKKFRKKYSTPSHPWQRDRILNEDRLKQDYGLKNKLEVWKANSLVKDLRDKARAYVVSLDDDASIKSKLFVQRIYDLGLINSIDKGVDDILTLKVENVLERRLESMMYKKKMVLSLKQARKFIAYKHVLVEGKVITAPGYLVPRSQEDKISFRENSPLANEKHPVRESIKAYYENSETPEGEMIEIKRTEVVVEDFRNKRKFNNKSKFNKGGRK